jgi:type 1 glutamine amidotransferase
MKILILCDDKYHPAQTVRAGLAYLEDAGYEMVWIEDARNFAPEDLDTYPVTVLSKSNNISSQDESAWMTDAVQDAFVTYVQGGNGLLAIHSGTAGYEATPRLRSLLGGVFLRHPAQCPVTVQPIDGHPLTMGSSSFTLQDEHYFMALDDDQADVFLTTVSDHGQQPGGWRRTVDQGRVCVLTPGHNLPVWEHPSYQALIVNALNWVSR